MWKEYDANEYVTLLDKNQCKFSNVVGYCNNLSHRGYVSKSLLKSHECIEKQCPLLTKCNANYWTQIEKERIGACQRRGIARQEKFKAAQREEFIRNVFESYDYIHITSIKEMKTGFIITYIYNKRVDLSEAAAILRKKYQCSIYLKAIRSRKEIQRQLIRNRDDKQIC